MMKAEMLDCQNAPTSQLPRDWRLSKLSDVADINPGRTKPKSGDDEVSFLAMGDVSEDGRVIGRQRRSYQDVAKGFTSFVENDVLVAKITPCFENGKGALATNLLSGIGFGSTEFHVIRAKEGHALPSFLHLHTRDESFRRNGERNMVGSAGQKRVPTDFLREYEIALPPIREQQKIAAILASVDDKLDVIARQIEATQTLKHGLMQTLFSRGVGTQDADGQWVPHAEFKDSELGAIPVRWEVKPLGAMSQESRVRNAGSLDDALLCGVLKEQGLVPMRERVKGATTERCRIVESNAFAYNPMRINIGSIARNPRNHSVMVSPDYVVFATKAGELMYSYLDHFRRSDEWQRFVGRSGDGGVRIRIYYDDLAQLRMRVPPLKEQARIVDVLDCVTKKIDNLTTKHREFQILRRGLMRKLLTGEWRVKLEDIESLAA
ncbi:restriction endonuclease subunit S [Cupriavidus numazuensis]|uniref:Type I restriction modification DNA specificity domain-containing protein n=1 Tax=Cupriavidus numazuensis TaxID=221992 RepID=A0ABN7Q8A6_9BURK|nr:restriction endonuclease subunit S [Cupriavidus numazuensis]CAG2159430.1 hypothetical protein LMG26411_06699 [Cupriavidus numazuensis]